MGGSKAVWIFSENSSILGAEASLKGTPFMEHAFLFLILLDSVFIGYLPLPPVLLCQDKFKLSVDILGVDIVDKGHQVGVVDSIAQHSKEDAVRNVGHHGQAGYG